MFSKIIDGFIGWLVDIVMSRLVAPMLKWAWKQVQPFTQILGILLLFRFRRFLPRSSRQLVTMGTTIVVLALLAEQVRKSKALAGT